MYCAMLALLAMALRDCLCGQAGGQTLASRVAPTAHLHDGVVIEPRCEGVHEADTIDGDGREPRAVDDLMCDAGLRTRMFLQM
jgi:hypothetical protein